MRKIGTIANVYENGQMQVVEDDVLNIVRKLRDISPRLTVYWNDHLNCFTLTETSIDGAEERLVFNVPELDERVVDRVLVADQWQGNDVPAHLKPEGEDWLTVVEADEERIDRDKTERERDRMGGIIEELASYGDLDGRGTKASILIPKGVRSVPDGTV